jgi:hypothetical protein
MALLLGATNASVLAQHNDTVPPKKEPPFFIHPSKRIPDDELTHKKEGYFITGLPEIEKNPINGLGIGANFYLYNNRTKEDPFFAYTPYR